jgi:hypothetical protein
LDVAVGARQGLQERLTALEEVRRQQVLQEQLNKLAALEQRVVGVERTLANQTSTSTLVNQTSISAVIAWGATQANTLNDVLQQVNIIASADPAVNSKKTEITNRVTLLLTRLSTPPKTKQEAMYDQRNGRILSYNTVYYY